MQTTTTNASKKAIWQLKLRFTSIQNIPMNSEMQKKSDFKIHFHRHTAVWRYPHVKWEIENFSQITTTAPIFLQFNYFRQKYL